MDTNLLDIQKGMTVYGSDGDEIGRVTEIWHDTAAYGSVAQSATQLDDYGPISGSPVDSATGTGYFQMERTGILGVGTKQWYVPFDAVQEAVPGESLTIDCDVDACDELYGEKPDFLSGGL